MTGSFLSAQSFSSSVGGGTIRWYRSNSSGIAIEHIPSRLAALRNEFCLSIEKADPDNIPPVLYYHYNDTLTAELRILYENGKENRRQWIFRDSRGLVRICSSGSPGFFAEDFFFIKPVADDEDQAEEDQDDENQDVEKESIAGFIEIRNIDGLLVKELQYDEDRAEWEFLYSYKDGSLLSAETWYKAPPVLVSRKETDISGDLPYVDVDEDEEYSEPETAGDSTDGAGYGADNGADNGTIEQNISGFILICTDYYRYSRPGSLRAIERLINKETQGKTRIPFPRLGPGGSQVEEIVTPRIAYLPDFLSDVYSGAGERVNYSVDPRGRILTEVWKDGDDKVIGEIKNTWDGDRLGSILWKSHDQTLLVEFEYDKDGNRIVERNFRQGVLERSVTSRGDFDIEEIYMNGRLMLRAVWEKGLKKSEERVAPSRGNR